MEVIFTNGECCKKYVESTQNRGRWWGEGKWLTLQLIQILFGRIWAKQNHSFLVQSCKTPKLDFQIKGFY